MRLYEMLASELNMSPEEAELLIAGCRIGNGLIQVPREVELYPVYRFFCRLIGDGELKVRKIVSIYAEASDNKATANALFARQTGVKENMIAMIQNFSKVIFPSAMEYQDLQILNGRGVITSQTANFKSHSKPIQALNDVYLFTCDEPMDITMQTSCDSGRRSIQQNSAIMLDTYAIPIQSSHVLWDQVRIVNYDEASRCIFYRLIDFTDEAFLSIMNDFRKSFNSLAEVAESNEDVNYNSNAYWAECVQSMQIELKFKPSDKRGWTAIMREFRSVRSLKGFEDAINSGSKTEAIILLSNISMVSRDLAGKIVDYFNDKFKRRMV